MPISVGFVDLRLRGDLDAAIPYDESYGGLVAVARAAGAFRGVER